MAGIFETLGAGLIVLALNGLTAVRRGRFYAIEETAEIARSPLPIYSSGSPVPSERLVTRVQRPRNLNAEDAARVLAPLHSRNGDVTAHAASNTLALTDTDTSIRRMLQLLEALDVPAPGAQVRIEPVRYALASELAARVNAAFEGAPGERPVRIVADDRTDLLLIVATPTAHARVLEMLHRYDTQ